MHTETAIGLPRRQDRGRFCVTDTQTHLDLLFVRDTEPSPVLRPCLAPVLLFTIISFYEKMMERQEDKVAAQTQGICGGSFDDMIYIL